MITITIGANDILACDPAVQVCVQAQLTQLATNLPQILQAINQAAPEVSIVGMNYYNPNLAYWADRTSGYRLCPQQQRAGEGLQRRARPAVHGIGDPVR